MPADVTVSREIAASPEKLWAMISDLPSMGKWSPENTGGSWVKGATGPAVGARFVGTNAAGTKTWKTTAKVVECAAPRAFAFDITVGPVKVARWGYTIAPSESGSTVTESWTDHRNWLIKKIPSPTGVKDRAAANRAGMEMTLANLAAAAEQA